MPGGVVEGRYLSHQGRKPGSAPWGLPPSGPALAPAGERALSLEALPHGKEASPEGEYRNLRGVELRRKGEGHGSTGWGGNSPPGFRRPSQPLPASREGGWPPKGHSHGSHGLSVAAQSGPLDQPRRGPATQGQPRRSQAQMGRGCPGQPRRNRGGREVAKGRRGALWPLGLLGASSTWGEKPPLGPPTGGPTPRPHRAGVVFLSAAS